ncbi:protein NONRESPONDING TO OXYLIPINS 2, mitochondrial isoform X2 [Trifolium pratense]|uniref:Uncharacterized protein n=1 Tax=Trifolium pratense TaxID=57577 RepID=A0ACB0MCK6_TRIPR|nr:protein NONRESPONDING TO OXYLIPINS 2, mitochondrial isoform X2 [Trifolium pratense]CAJ2679258.1 unnamed protein product [Trifolium pratense]
MASSFCKSAVRVASSSFANRSRTFAQKQSIPLLFSSQAAPPRVSRILSVVGSVESLMPLHTAIADARLTSNIASNSTCWSMLSQDFAVPR